MGPLPAGSMLFCNMITVEFSDSLLGFFANIGG